MDNVKAHAPSLTTALEISNVLFKTLQEIGQLLHASAQTECYLDPTATVN